MPHTQKKRAREWGGRKGGRERESNNLRVKNLQASSAIIFSRSHFFLLKSAQTNRAAKSCSNKNYLKILKYSPITKWMCARSFKSVKRLRQKVKNKSFPAGKRTKCTRKQDHPVMLAHKVKVGQRMQIARVSFKIDIEIKSTMLLSFWKVTNVAFHPSFLDALFYPQGDSCESCPQRKLSEIVH